jgi:hypothetical protein
MDFGSKLWTQLGCFQGIFLSGAMNADTEEQEKPLLLVFCISMMQEVKTSCRKLMWRHET